MLPEAASTVATAKAIAGHVGRWLANLRRAGDARRQQSLRAVNAAVSLLRQTQAYARGLKAGKQDFNMESRLAGSWADLSFELAQLKLPALAKKCDLMSRFWADPAAFPPAFLADADIGFAAVERLARELSVQIRLGKLPR